MTKKNVNYVPKDKLLAIAREAGCKIEDQKGFHKVTGDQPMRALYIGNTKNCGRIDISGFTHELGVVHFKAPTKRVEQMVDFTQPETTTLRTLFLLIRDGLWKAAEQPAPEPQQEPAPEEQGTPAEVPAQAQG